MLTSSHGYLGLRLTRGRRHRPWLVVGAVGPDLPAFGVGLALRISGVAPDKIVDRVYRKGASRRVQLAAHSLLACAALSVTAPADSWRRAIATGWLSHLVIDAVSHHDDAWPFLWPLSGRRWRSPLSYWQPEHHGRAWRAVECTALLAAITDDQKATARVLGAVAGLLAAHSWYVPRDPAAGHAESSVRSWWSSRSPLRRLRSS